MMMDATNILLRDAEPLQPLHDAFRAAGFNMWFVGGCVRDAIMGIDPKDIDLCTDATPDEQIEIYRARRDSFHLTGIEHGTITVVIDHVPYEITSLRTDLECDGRRATVGWTRDLKTDLERRDLTFNAIAMDFEGNIIDPFGGVDDLANRRARMVGDAEQRFVEDYLRILRFFRFHARIAGAKPLDPTAVAAIEKLKDGLSTISVERIWMEIQKIIVGPYAAETMQKLYDLGIAPIIGLPRGNIEAIRNTRTNNPAAVMGLFLKPNDLSEVATRWKWSRQEKLVGKFIAQRKNEKPTDAEIKALLVDGWDRNDVRIWLDVIGYPTTIVDTWQVPKFPVHGETLMAKGITGIELGQTIKRLKAAWADSDYQATEEELVKLV